MPCPSQTVCPLQCGRCPAPHPKELDIKKGAAIYFAGMPAHAVYVVKAGSVRLTAGDRFGGSRIVRFAQAGDVFGVDSLLPSAVYTFTAAARERSTVCFVDPERLRTLVEGDVRVAWRLVAAFARLLQCAELERADISGQRARRRLIAINNRLRGRVARDDAGGACPGMAEIAQWELAQFLGLSEETVSRELAKLRAGRTAAKGVRTGAGAS
jgi:CRP-like cAMP-binding protein